MKTAVLTVVIMVIFLSTAPAGGMQGEYAPLTLSLKPVKASYSLEDAGRGNVTITARFTNDGDGAIFLAHPNACVPEGFGMGSSMSIEERYGVSEILLYITKPDGTEVVLRNNVLRGFEPGNHFHLTIAPGGTEEITLGWLGPEFALGQWDGFDGQFFDQRGIYKVWMLYRNHYGKAASFKPAPDLFMDEAPWQGEVESDAVDVAVE